MKPYQIPRIPSTIDDFTSIRDGLANSPEGGAAVFILAMMLYAKDKTLGMQALTIAMDRNNLREEMTGYKGFALSRSYDYHLGNFSKKPYWANAYIDGTSPDNGYALGSAPYTLQIGRNSSSEQANGVIKVFVKCSGADSPRPIALKANDKGIWKVSECSSMFLDMRAPDSKISDDL